MRSRFILAALLIALASLSSRAQVAPAARVSGLPLAVGGGISDFDLDYCCGRRMIGASVWVDYNLFHGLGLTVKGTSIFADKPEVLQRMRQDSAVGGLVFKPRRTFFRIRPEVKWMGGIGSIDFPSGNPHYTHDTYPMSAVEGGGEYRLWQNLYAHGDYEYQWWYGFQNRQALTPSGFTFGATYYLRGVHGHS